MTQGSVATLPAIFDGIEAVCFDAFGTLVEITNKQQVFRPFFKSLPLDKRRELTRRLMREDRPFTDWPKALGVEFDAYVQLEVLKRFIDESSSIAQRPGMADIWVRLRAEGMRLAICSNLANDYVPELRRKLPDLPDVEVLSCKVGVIKPEPEIYIYVLDRLSLDPCRVLFVGDSARSDIEGPCAAGMKAIHVDELVAAMQPE